MLLSVCLNLLNKEIAVYKLYIIQGHKKRFDTYKKNHKFKSNEGNAIILFAKYLAILRD